MKKKAKEPTVPFERKETIRKNIIVFLKGRQFSAKEISGVVSIPEKEVYEHLGHIQKTLHKDGQALAVTPAECRRCGFVFQKREKFKRPGRCPVCKNESIEEPLFAIS